MVKYDIKVIKDVQNEQLKDISGDDNTMMEFY
jgi:hypothetical protein